MFLECQNVVECLHKFIVKVRKAVAQIPVERLADNVDMIRVLVHAGPECIESLKILSQQGSLSVVGCGNEDIAHLFLSIFVTQNLLARLSQVFEGLSAAADDHPPTWTGQLEHSIRVLSNETSRIVNGAGRSHRAYIPFCNPLSSSPDLEI